MKPRTIFQKAFESPASTGSYSVARASAPIDLWLDANEGRAPNAVDLPPAEILRRYPDKAPLEALLAEHNGALPQQVVVTNGGDDAIDRICRGFLEPGTHLLMTVPGFEMIATYARLAGAEVRHVHWWSADFPWDELRAAVDAQTRVVAVVSPNNPTGAVVDPHDVVEFATDHPQLLVLLDLAYTEFADDRAQDVVRDVPNIVTVRTLSKAYGLAGLRVGYAIGAVSVCNVLRSASGPYPVSSASLFMAQHVLESTDPAPYLAEVRRERDILRQWAEDVGWRAQPSQANFVFAEVGDGARVRDGLAGFGIAVRAWPGKREPVDLTGHVRISCPGDPQDFARLMHALNCLEKPELLIFDMDGVLVDVSSSYRQAIVRTAASFGVSVTAADIAAQKAMGNANNDWRVTQRLMMAQGVDADFDEIVRRFEDLYQGTSTTPGLWKTEVLLTNRVWLNRLKENGFGMAVVTGRPRRDADRLIDHFGLSGIFETMVCMEDGPLKPDPWPLEEALRRTGARHAWMFGDTRDDMVACRRAGVLPVGVLAPGDCDREVLYAAGAGFVVKNIENVESLLPERT